MDTNCSPRAQEPSTLGGPGVVGSFGGVCRDLHRRGTSKRRVSSHASRRRVAPRTRCVLSAPCPRHVREVTQHGLGARYRETAWGCVMCRLPRGQPRPASARRVLWGSHHLTSQTRTMCCVCLYLYFFLQVSLVPTARYIQTSSLPTDKSFFRLLTVTRG